MTCLLAAASPVLVVPAEAASAPVAMVAIEFRPREIKVAVGDTVTWHHKDGEPHTVTADDATYDSSPVCEPVAGTGCMDTGDTWSHTYGAAGRYPYFCKVHGKPGGEGMAGAVIVE
jgi:plastocyanin